MYANYLGTVLFIVAAWLTGLAFLHLTGIIKGSYKNIHWVSLPIGITINVIIAAIIYFELSLTVSIIRIVYAIMAVLSLGFLIYKKIEKCISSAY